MAKVDHLPSISDLTSSDHAIAHVSSCVVLRNSGENSVRHEEEKDHLDIVGILCVDDRVVEEQADPEAYNVGKQDKCFQDGLSKRFVHLVESSPPLDPAHLLEVLIAPKLEPYRVLHTTNVPTSSLLEVTNEALRLHA